MFYIKNPLGNPSKFTVRPRSQFSWKFTVGFQPKSWIFQLCTSARRRSRLIHRRLSARDFIRRHESLVNNVNSRNSMLQSTYEHN